MLPLWTISSISWSHKVGRSSPRYIPFRRNNSKKARVSIIVSDAWPAINPSSRHKQKIDPNARKDDDDDPKVPLKLEGAFQIPLGNLALKTTTEALSRFLLNPLHARPSGRIPRSTCLPTTQPPSLPICDPYPRSLAPQSRHPHSRLIRKNPRVAKDYSHRSAAFLPRYRNLPRTNAA